MNGIHVLLVFARNIFWNLSWISIWS